MTCLPCATRLAICVAQAAIANLSRPLPSLVTRLDPTLTTITLASTSSDFNSSVVMLLVFYRHLIRGHRFINQAGFFKFTCRRVRFQCRAFGFVYVRHDSVG